MGQKASTEEIKKSFRRLAHEFHPDKNPSNVFAEARFREIHEAYTVLSHEEKRSMYDYERWLSGRFSKNTVILTPQYFLQEIGKLNAHIAVIDVYRMNKQLLHQYLMFLMGDEKMAILQLKAESRILQEIVGELLKVIRPLPPYYAKEALSRLKVLAEGHPAEVSAIDKALNKIIREEKWQRSVPWLVLLVTVLLCITMYLFSKK